MLIAHVARCRAVSRVLRAVYKKLEHGSGTMVKRNRKPRIEEDHNMTDNRRATPGYKRVNGDPDGESLESNPCSNNGQQRLSINGITLNSTLHKKK